MSGAAAFEDVLDDALRAEGLPREQPEPARLPRPTILTRPLAMRDGGASAQAPAVEPVTPRAEPQLRLVQTPEPPSAPTPADAEPVAVDMAMRETDPRAFADPADADERPVAEVTVLRWPSVRPGRRLTRRQRQALDELVAFGASLGPDFTEAELRRAFRQLARRYHPDRHRLSSPAEKARLSRLFARLTDYYRCLLGT